MRLRAVGVVTATSPTPLQQLQQLGEVRRHAAALVLGFAGSAARKTHEGKSRSVGRSWC
jgi:hypothetical protein